MSKDRYSRQAGTDDGKDPSEQFKFADAEA